MEILDLNHVAIHVSDLQASIEFYKNKLGLEELSRPDFDFGGAWFRLGTQQELHLIEGREEPVSSLQRGSHFALQVGSIQRAEESLQRAAVEYRPKRERPDGAWQIFLKDPDGYFIELCELPTGRQ